MNDRVINSLHWSFAFSMLVMFFGVLLVSGKKVSVHVWVKKCFFFLFQRVTYFQV